MSCPLFLSTYEQLEEIVGLAAQSLPGRPDGIVTVAKFTSAQSDSCRSTEAEYERVARANPATLFLRCFKEYESSEILFGQAQVTVLPTFDLFYRGKCHPRINCKTKLAGRTGHCQRNLIDPPLIHRSRKSSRTSGRLKLERSRRAARALSVSKFQT
jgi:hypothetical protein